MKRAMCTPGCTGGERGAGGVGERTEAPGSLPPCAPAPAGAACTPSPSMVNALRLVYRHFTLRGCTSPWCRSTAMQVMVRISVTTAVHWAKGTILQTKAPAAGDTGHTKGRKVGPVSLHRNSALQPPAKGSRLSFRDRGSAAGNGPAGWYLLSRLDSEFLRCT